MVRLLLFPTLMLLATVNARAIELKVTAGAMERTLQQQLFNAPDGRYYIQGNANAACFVYVDQPSVRFQDDRVVIHVHTHSRLGAGMFGRCVGVGFNTEADVSVVPDAEGETIGFRDARIDRFTGNKELDALLIPFLSRKLPQKLKIDAADLLRTALARSRQSSGYEVTLDHLKIHSMLVQDGVLAVDLDGSLRVN
ncbi:hypothetical protein [Terriglobus sp.]|uniref:hypothetical protein n=1 Tax=Terriglobus sp. TaxID=1889013 RepID=UPI003AFFA7A3